MMKTSDFDYDLPEHFIAQTPVEPRDAARLLVVERASGRMEHTTFHEIGKYLKRNDLLVLNQTRVNPARLFARKDSGGRVEVLLLRREDALTWEALVGGKGMTAGREVAVENGPRARVVDALEGARRRIRFEAPVEDYFASAGHVPLPPYIHERLADPERYQTVFAKVPGSAAAPTAGLHFTAGLLESLKLQGVNSAILTLHVGLDTFAPVTEADPMEHRIHTEWCELPLETARAINRTRQAGGRVIAVGTTSVRTIESAPGGEAIEAHAGDTRVFITPGYSFRFVDGMVTNFHLPKSTLIMLVSAFAGRALVMEAYETAKKESYRFFSFGDAMLIL